MKVIFVNKGGYVKDSSIKLNSINDLYKKCGLKTNKHFENVHTWHHKGAYYSVFAKVNGKANTENKYELPPPVDNELYFGTMVIVKHSTKTLKHVEDIDDLTKKDWLVVYEEMFGGFEDLDEEEEESEEEEIPEHLKTKQGYMKDGFVVDDDEEDDDYEPEDEEESEEESEEDTNEETNDDDDESYEEYSEETDNNDSEEVDEDEHDEEEDEEDDDDETEYSELSEEEYD